MPSPLDFGVDVSKDSLQVTCAESPMQQQQVANQRASIRTWLAQLPSGSRVAMEATGAYHRLLADLAHAQGMQVYVLNPCDLRHYARAVGARSKTDRVDANVDRPLSRPRACRAASVPAAHASATGPLMACSPACDHDGRQEPLRLVWPA